MKIQKMTKFRIISIGKLPPEYHLISQHFLKMLGKDFEVIELVSKKNTTEHESQLILEKLKPTDFVVLLDIQGNRFTSKKFSEYLTRISVDYDGICFVIGGAFGVSEDVKIRANSKLSLSDMTFPHMLARIMLLEQIYRAISIAQNHPYHK